ncbi:MAG: phytoene/squalene synthase family protein [Thermoproteus sp.]
MSSLHYAFFRKGRNFFYSSVLFPRPVRDEVAVLYSFVRYVDDLVDRPEPLVEDFYRAWRLTERSLDGAVNPPVIGDFAELARRRGFDRRWIEAFLESMEMDLYKKRYATFGELLRYIYGSAEVIGLFMAKILGLPPASYPYARLLGRAYQLINMIRDVGEDLALGRVYIPEEDMERFGARGVGPTEEFAQVVRYELARYLHIQKAAEEGYRYIPRRLLPAIKTASDLYKRTAMLIWRRPLSVLSRKVRPRFGEVVLLYIKNVAWI